MITGVKIPILVGLQFSGVEALAKLLSERTNCCILVPENKCFQLFTKPFAERNPSFDELVELLLQNFPEYSKLPIAEDLLQLKNLPSWDLSGVLKIFFELLATRQSKLRFGLAAPTECDPVIARKVLPDVHFVHVVRDGREFASCAMNRRLMSAAEVAQLWAEYLDIFYKQEQEGRGVSVRIEDFVENADEAIKPVCDYFKLSYSPVGAKPHPWADSFSLANDTDLSIDVVSEPLSEEELAEFEAVAAIALDQYGYQSLQDV